MLTFEVFCSVPRLFVQSLNLENCYREPVQFSEKTNKKAGKKKKVVFAQHRAKEWASGHLQMQLPNFTSLS